MNLHLPAPKHAPAPAHSLEEAVLQWVQRQPSASPLSPAAPALTPSPREK